MKTGIVTNVFDRKSHFNNDYGTFHSWGVQFDNGDKGVFNVKDDYEPRFKIGTKAGYKIEPNGKYPNKIEYVDLEYEEKKAANPGRSDGRSKDDINSIIWQSCFSSVCAAKAGSSITGMDQVLEWTDEAYHHCKALTENYVHVVDTGNMGSDLKGLEEEDDLPF